MFTDHLAIALSILLRVFSLWFLLTALLFWKRPKPYPLRAPKTRFACLIPARNEEAVVGALVESLRAQDYPDALYDIYVIPNNCTDGTEDAARAAGAKIFRCFDPVKNKGDALHETIAWLLPRRMENRPTAPEYDAFCVFDADNVADSHFLARMNDAFLAGAKVAKGRLLVKNPRDSWVAGCYSLYFTLGDLFFSRSRANLGLSAKLVGTGFAVNREVFERLGGWNTSSIAEDAEFSAQCAALGERVWWVSDAVSYDEAPVSFRVSLTQRRRWCSGIMAAAVIMLPRLLRAAPNADRSRAVDSVFFLCSPFAQALSVLPPLLLAFGAAAEKTLAGWTLLTAASLTLGFCGALLGACALAFLAHRRCCALAVLLFPLFMASFLPLQLLALLRPTTQWHTIRHERNVAFAQLSCQNE